MLIYIHDLEHKTGQGERYVAASQAVLNSVLTNDINGILKQEFKNISKR